MKDEQAIEKEITNDRPDPELDRTLSAVNDAMKEPQNG